MSDAECVDLSALLIAGLLVMQFVWWGVHRVARERWRASVASLGEVIAVYAFKAEESARRRRNVAEMAGKAGAFKVTAGGFDFECVFDGCYSRPGDYADEVCDRHVSVVATAYVMAGLHLAKCVTEGDDDDVKAAVLAIAGMTKSIVPYISVLTMDPGDDGGDT